MVSGDGRVRRLLWGKSYYLENKLLLISINFTPKTNLTVALQKMILSYVFQVTPFFGGLSFQLGLCLFEGSDGVKSVTFRGSMEDDR